MLIRSERTQAAEVEQIDLLDAKAHLRVEHDDDDVLIESLIAVAREEAEAVVGRRYGAQEWALYYDHFKPIRLNGCGKVTSATVYYRDLNGAWQALDASTYEVVKAVPAFVSYRDNFNVPTVGDYAEVVKVVTQCGEDAPPSIKQWMLLRIGSLYETREADSDKRVEPQQFVHSLLAAHRVVDFS